jgi:divalent metal cation (Fe/Co/Zn/Cd) transporter
VTYVFRAAYRIIHDTSSVLTDSAVVDPHLVEDIARSVRGVWYATKVRSRGREDDVHLDLHIKVDPAMATEQAHSIANEVERLLKVAVPGLVDAIVNIEPGETPALSDWEAITVRLRAIADGLGLGVHNVHIDVLNGGYLVDVDVEVTSDLSLTQSHALVSEFEARARRGLPQMTEIVTHIEPTLPGDFPNPLIDDDAAGLRDQILEIADRIGGSNAAHHVILRHSHSPDHIDVSLHCSAPGDSSLIEAHLLAERVERQLRAELPQLDHITIHVEPPGSPDL